MQASAGASINYSSGNNPRFDETLVPSPIALPPLNASDSFSGDGITASDSAAMSGTVQYGSITASAAATGIETSAGTPTGYPLSLTKAYAGFNGVWFDSLLVNSATLPVGSPVALQFTLATKADTTCSGRYAYVSL